MRMISGNLYLKEAKNDFSNKWKEKVHIIRWFLAYKKVNFW